MLGIYAPRTIPSQCNYFCNQLMITCCKKSQELRRFPDSCVSKKGFCRGRKKSRFPTSSTFHVMISLEIPPMIEGGQYMCTCKPAPPKTRVGWRGTIGFKICVCLWCRVRPSMLNFSLSVFYSKSVNCDLDPLPISTSSCGQKPDGHNNMYAARPLNLALKSCAGHLSRPSASAL